MAKVSIDQGRIYAYLVLVSPDSIEKALNNFHEKLTPLDYRFAYEIASGVVRRDLSLCYYISQIQKKIKLQRKEKILLKMALYQYKFMDKIPYFALCHQTIEIAKKQKLKNIPFLNALLRKFEKTTFSLPEDDSPKSLSIYYSYPVLFVERLLKEVGLAKTRALLGRMNKIYPSYARDRNTGKYLVIEDKKKIDQIKDDPNFSIQNPTFSKIMHELNKGIKEPKKILDLCAAPGGKLLYVHDLYPKAKLFANDLREKQLKENCEKYDLSAKLFSEDATTFSGTERFDLIILDVPCSNSGVLGKRVEARYRITKEKLEELADLQVKMLKNAKNLLAQGGIVWYITCSILQEENKRVIDSAKKLGYKLKGDSITIYPDEDGLDGGYGACLELH